MSALSTIIYAAMMGITLFALFEISRKPRQQTNNWLMVLLGLLLLHILGELYIYSGAYRYAPSIAGISFPLRVLMGPALYFYAVAVMSVERPSRRAYLLALFWPFLVTALMLPFILFISPEQKLALADPATRDPQLWQIALLTCLFATGVFIMVTLVYLMAALKLHSRHREQLMARFSSIEAHSFNWLRWILWLWGGVWILFALEYALSALGLYWLGSGVLLPVLEALVLTLFIHHVLNQPELEENYKGAKLSATARIATLSEESMQQIAEKLLQAMQQERLYLQDDLSLYRLADVVGVSENHLSETFSQHLNTNFFQYINGFRIAAAQQQLRDKNKLISTIAYDVGFKSKSTFNTAFKKRLGTTPSDYRQEVMSQKASE